jgi:ERCC4-type nuclease
VGIVYSPTYDLLREIIFKIQSSSEITLSEDGTISGPDELKDMIEYLSYKNALGLLQIAMSSMKLNVLESSYALKANQSKIDLNSNKDVESNNKDSLKNEKTSKEYFEQKIKDIETDINNKSKIIMTKKQISDMVDSYKDKRIEEQKKRVEGNK